ncbi:hypothetical protein FRX31_025270 [Thalictrum thalictroides]|uniref:Uncharacterized protein n=1 Tax=Thalictrum thalictroides TaxID=46969 RepID=A0A7J6VJ66_THATH|nr:hypothetical protein FRX31_025270 [Thalictrum thalictroides]
MDNNGNSDTTGTISCNDSRGSRLKFTPAIELRAKIETSTLGSDMGVWDYRENQGYRSRHSQKCKPGINRGNQLMTRFYTNIQ